MADYEELYSLWHESDLKNRVMVAVIVAAQTIQEEALATENHANRLLWSQQAFENPVAVANPIYRVILAVNKSLTQEAILGASDTSIQTAVDAAVDTFATGG